MFKLKILTAFAATLALGSALSLPAFSQGTTTLRNPLIPGAQSTPPGTAPAEGLPPPPGDGSTPVGVTPGMGGNPTFEPWVPAIPANQIDIGSSGIPLPISPGVASPPGVIGPALTGVVPNSPSTPGADAGMLYVPPFAQTFVPSDQVNIIPTGGLPGDGGYNTSISKVRRGGQETHQWELRGRHQNFAAGSGAPGDIQDEVARVGPLAGFGMPFGVPTGNGFDKGPPGAGSDLRLNDIDLGGGQRLKMGGTKISTGSSIQDFGLSDTRNNPVGALNAWQSTEFGQGFRRIPLFSNKSTDFGFPYAQFDPSNEGPQKTGQLLLPKAVETNF